MTNQTSIPIPEEISKRITSLRFILIVFVIFIHNNFTEANAISYDMEFNQPEWTHWIKIFFSESLCQCAVPLFFFFSGYLRTYNIKPYYKFISSRLKTVFLPYFIWTLLTVMFYWIAQKNSFLAQYFSKEENIISNYTIQQWGGVITGIGRENNWPLVFQFWFLRDLIVLELFSPILDCLIKRIPLFLILLETILLFLNEDLSILSSISIFSYTLGSLCGKRRMNFFEFSDLFSEWQIIISFFMIVLFKNLFIEKIDFLQVINIAVIVLSALLLLRCSAYMINNEIVFSRLKLLAVFSFFLYAFHAPLFEISLNKLTYKFFFAIPHIGYCLQYFFSPLVTIFIGLFTGMFIRRYIPFIFAVLNGKR